MNNIKRIVVKVGTTTLTYENGKMNFQRIDKLARVLTDLQNQGFQVILVTSGAVAVGTDKLGLKERPRDIRGKQAASAVGQGILMEIYEKFFMEYNQLVAQILLTKEIITEETRRTNAINTFDELIKMGVIPIVNENDTVATDELDFSDNDTLSAYVANLTKSDLLIILSDIEGFFDGDPHIKKDAKLITEVNKIDDYIIGLAGGSNGKLGTGGMATKITAASICMNENITMFIVGGTNPSIIYDVVENRPVGTKFIAKK